jgi:3-oxoacyl-[acyl-carrier-protein] synthase-3
VTITPDYLFPGNSSVLHEKLALSENVPCFDIAHGCSGYVYGLLQALMLVSAGAKRVLLVVGETASKTLDPTDRSTQVLFGDAGSATLVEAEPNSEIELAAGSCGAGHQKICYPGSAHRLSTLPKFMRMDGPAVVEFILNVVPEHIESVLKHFDIRKEEIGLFFLHQANQIALRHLVKKLRIDPARAPVTLGNFGNTGSASIPLGIVTSKDSFDKSSWSRVLVSGFGVGLSWGTAICDLSRCRVPELVELGDGNG